MSTSVKPPFPDRPENRPALPRIDYRIGGYAEIRDAIWSRINAAPELSEWTHREADDPGAALVEVAAVVGDILTFYQEHYANEAFLRTAGWDESIRELVRLTGYRLGSATAGEVFFAFTVKGEKSVEIPASFPVKAELADEEKPVDFLTSEAAMAEPDLSEFHLYRSRNMASGLAYGATEFEIARVDGSEDPALRDLLDLKKGDKLMIIPNEPSWVNSGGSIGTQPVSHQNVEVKEVTRLLDRLIVETVAPIRTSRTGTVRAYRIGRTFSHFGHNAPMKRHESKIEGGVVTGTREYDTIFTRHWDHDCSLPSLLTTSETLAPQTIPLDQEVNDLLVGSTMITEVPVEFGDELRKIVVAREIESLRAGPFGVGDLHGSTTFVTFDEMIADWNSAGYPQSDLRMVRVHETTSPELQLRRKTTYPGGNFSNTNELFFYGGADEALKLLDREVIFKAEDGRYAKRQVVAVDTLLPSYPRMRQVTLDAKLDDFQRSDFDEEETSVTVYGNIVHATQGKLEAVAVLGNGDMRETFQSFKIPKAPLTHLSDPAATPSAQPELLIRVEGRQWQVVDSLFGRGPKDEVYIVRHDDDGNAWVQFGDGVMGTRLPSGVKNVTAEYRTGVGALGEVKEEAKPTGGAKLDRLEKIFLPGEVTGGSSGEASENARLNAPAALQSLGRLVSLADYESEALSLPGAVTAKAAWEISDGSPAIQIRLLLEQQQQSEVQFEAAAATIRQADKARGIDRYPVEVVQCELRYFYLTLQYGYDPALTASDVEAAIKWQLGLADDEATQRTGLFGLFNRELGQAEYRLGVEGAAQNAGGVLWCRVSRLGLLSPGDDPTELYRPYHEANFNRLPCSPTELLQLHSSHLILTPADS